MLPLYWSPVLGILVAHSYTNQAHMQDFKKGGLSTMTFPVCMHIRRDTPTGGLCTVIIHFKSTINVVHWF